VLDSRHLAAIVDSSADAIISEDLHGNILSWNAGAEHLFGYSAAEMTGRNIRALIPAHRLHEEDQELACIRAGRTLTIVETVRLHKDGREIPVAVSVSPVLDADGRIVGGAKIARDLSARVAAESQLRDAHTRLLSLVRASRILNDVTDVRQVWRRSVALAQEALAADGYALWRRNDSDEWAVLDAVGVSEAFAHRVVAAGRMPRGHSRVLERPMLIADVYAIPLLASLADTYRAEGIQSMAVFPLLLHGSPQGTLVLYYRSKRVLSELESQTGEALANLVAAAVSTAELYAREREAAARAARKAQQAAFLSDATRVLNESLDYQQTLSAVATLAVPHIADWCAVDMLSSGGLVQRLAVAHVDPAKVTLAQDLYDRYPPDPHAPIGVHHVLRTGEAEMLSRIPHELIERGARDLEHRRLIETLSLTSYMCVPLLTRRGPVGAITFVSAESGREYSVDDLAFAKDVAGRAALAIENALAYKEASEANRLKDDFLAALSHEIRTPLNAVIGYVRMLRDGTIDRQKETRSFEIIERNASALQHLVEDILDVSRITTGRLQIESELLDLAVVLDRAVSTVTPAAHAKRIRLDVDAPAEALVRGDAGRLQQVLWNLLQNAVKFSAPGGHVKAAITVGAGSVTFTVSDDGEGITPEFLPHVFERFRQERSRQNHRMGLGLGLAIVKELIELHGGRVSAASAGPGRGATFTVSLPAAEATTPM
jgi:PAS domain S-box-containing protein